MLVGFDRALLNILLAQSGRILARHSPEALRRLCNRLLPVAQAARILGGEQGRLALVARGANGDELARLELRAETAGLEVPASPVVWALRRLLESRDVPAPGAAPLERLIEPDVALDWLRTHGVRVIEREAG
jgi:hypothetical protein